MKSNPSFGLMFFASHQDALVGEKYRLLIESARFGDRHGFARVWVPERHFTRFGCLFPNAAVLHAALSRETSRIGLNAGSVVLPLHDPLRVAEEWAMVDNLSGGRVGVSFASGWNPADFALQPENYADRHNLLFTNLEKVQTLWRGGSIPAIDGRNQPVQIAVFPTPVQPRLPVWITAAANPRTYERAGEAGAHLLTHLLDHGVEKLAGLIALYRRSRERHGHDPDAGIVTVMLHTFVGADEALVRDQVRRPFCEYLKANAGLLEGLAESRGQRIDLAALSAADLDAFTGFLFDRFYSSRALIGTPESCLHLVRELGVIGVNEIACLLDFGPPPELILEHLPHLNRLRSMAADEKPAHSLPSPAEVQGRCTIEISGTDFYRRLEDRGVELAGSFRCVERIWRRDGEAIAEIRKPVEAAGNEYLLHPGFLDCMFQVLVMAAPDTVFEEGVLYLPSGFRSFEVHGEPGDTVWSHAVAHLDPEKGIEGDITVVSSSGELVARAEGLRLKKSQVAGTVGETLLYDVEWLPAPLLPDADGQPSGPWLILPDKDGIAEHLQALLQSRGQHSVIARRTEWPVSPNGHGNWHGVLHLGEWHEILSLARSWPPSAHLWIASRGGQNVDGAPVSSDTAMLWGIGRTWAEEFPQGWGGLVDLDPSADAQECAAQLLSAITANDGEDQSAFRGGERYVARLTRGEAIPQRQLRLRPDSAYLITGGRQGFGLEAARRLAERGAGHLILLGRQPEPVHFPQLEALGASVTYAAVDVSDPVSVADFLANWHGPAIRGVIHAASIWKNEAGETLVRPLDQLDRASFDAVLGPKTGGAWALHRLLADQPLDFFVLFSSTTSLLGSPGQANYAAASVGLDALALRRHAEGLPALSINWGPISQAGFGATPQGERLHELWETLGIHRVAPREALDVMETLIRDGRPQAAVMRIDWAKATVARPGLARMKYLERVVGQGKRPALRPEFIQRFEAAPTGSRRQMLVSHIASLVAEVMELPANDSLDLHRGLFEYGFDSLMVLELKNRLQSTLGQDVPATLAFEYPTVQALANYFYGRLLPAEKSPPVPPVISDCSSSIDDMLKNLDAISDAEAAQTLRGRGFSA